MFKRNKKPSHKKRNAAIGVVVFSAVAYGVARALETKV